MKKIIILLLLSVCLIGCNTNENKELETFIVGMECNYAPFNWTDSYKSKTNYKIDGTNLFANGYDVQIAKRIANYLGKKLVIKAIKWEGLIAALENGQIDAIIAGMSPTDERKLSIDFTNEYYRSTHVLVMKEDSKFSNGKSLSDFQEAKVVGQVDTLYDSLIDQLVGIEHLTPLADVPTIITSIINNRADFTILEEPVAKGIVSQNPMLKYIKLENGFVVNDEDVIVSIGVRKNNNELLNQINEALNNIDKDTRNTIMLEAISLAGE